MEIKLTLTIAIMSASLTLSPAATTASSSLLWEKAAMTATSIVAMAAPTVKLMMGGSARMLSISYQSAEILVEMLNWRLH